jgi:hypothetical protein
MRQKKMTQPFTYAQWDGAAELAKWTKTDGTKITIPKKNGHCHHHHLLLPAKGG